MAAIDDTCAQARPARKLCDVDDCDRHARSSSAQYCEKHYYRVRRKGTTDYVGNIKPGNLKNAYGYVLIPARGHPRALGGYRAFEHRVVFTEAHGEGPFNCHWCGVAVTWDDMHVDHRNDVTDDNRPENLVASCVSCNVKRGTPKSAAAARRAGKLLTHAGETMCVAEWARRIGISPVSIEWRLAHDWPLERALTQPRGKFGPKAMTSRL